MQRLTGSDLDVASPAQRPGRAKRIRGVRGSPPDYSNPTRTHAEEGQAERSGQVKRSAKGGSGASPIWDSATCRYAKEAKRS